MRSKQAELWQAIEDLRCINSFMSYAISLMMEHSEFSPNEADRAGYMALNEYMNQKFQELQALAESGVKHDA